VRLIGNPSFPLILDQQINNIFNPSRFPSPGISDTVALLSHVHEFEYLALRCALPQQGLPSLPSLLSACCRDVDDPASSGSGVGSATEIVILTTVVGWEMGREKVCVGRGSSNRRAGSLGFWLLELTELQNSWCSAGLGLI
jgi:hypothetical protein